MATDLMVMVAGCLTPQEAELAQAILATTDDRSLDRETFAAMVRFADAPCPAMPPPGQDEFRKVILALAGVLKSARTSDEQGQLQLAMYWAALKDVELFRLQAAAEHFIKTAEWMPTPGQIRTQALTYTHPVWHAHSRARRFAQDRHQRLHDALMRRIKNRELTQEELDALPAGAQRAAVRNLLATPRPEGGVTYRTREALERWEEHQRSLTAQFMLEHGEEE